MRFVKLNNAVIINGDRIADYSFDKLEDYGMRLPKIKVNLLDDLVLTYNIEAKKNIRLHSRKTQLLLECLHHLNFSSLIEKLNRERIGFYIMGSHYNLDQEFPSYLPYRDGGISLQALYKAAVAPTHAIKNNTGIIPGHLAIFHDVHGPTFVITSNEPKQIFQKAWIDLQTNVVDLAVVGLVNNYDDPMVAALHSKQNINKILTEAAGVFLLKKSDQMPLLTENESPNYHGYLQGLIPAEKN